MDTYSNKNVYKDAIHLSENSFYILAYDATVDIPAETAFYLALKPGMSLVTIYRPSVESMYASQYDVAVIVTYAVETTAAACPGMRNNIVHVDDTTLALQEPEIRLNFRY